MSVDTLAAAIEAACVRFEGTAALIDGDHVVTYGDFGSAVVSLAQGFRTLGIAPGDRIVCRLPNSTESLVAACAAWHCRAIHVALPHDSTDPELETVVRGTRARVVVLAEPSQTVASAPPARQPEALAASILHVGLQETYAFWEFVQLNAVTLVPGHALATRDDPAVLLLTSGTTGRPKAIIHRHGSLVGAWRRYAAMLNARAGDVHLGHLPQSHAFGLAMAVACLLTGGSLVIMRRFSPRTVLEVVCARKVAILSGTPAHFRLILKHLDSCRDDVSHLRAGVGSSGLFDRTLVRDIFDCLSMRLVLVYGSTEGFGCRTDDPRVILRGSVGKPTPGSVAILGEGGEELPLGRVGEVAFRTAPASTHGSQLASPTPWYLTGDLGRLDSERYLYLQGRANDRINTGGTKVDPEEVEAYLATHPAVADCAVIAAADDVLGEVVCAVIVATSGGRCPTLTETREFLGTALARHKLPVELTAATSIPRDALGKVNRRALRGHT